MKSFIVTSIRTNSGKTTLALGMALNFFQNFGYFKPLGISSNGIDGDAMLFKNVFGLKEEISELCPSLVSREKKYSLKKHFDKISREKDFLIVESPPNFSFGAYCDLCSACIAKKLGLKGIVVAEGYLETLVDKVLVTKAYFESYNSEIVGVVVNKVPPHDLQETETTLVEILERRGIKVFGVVPEKKILSNFFLEDVLKVLEAEILYQTKEKKKIETTMVGAMNFDAALRFFRKHSNKLVITGGDRADIQLAALETSTSCLVLTGGLHPSPPVLARARELDVSVLVVKEDTFSAAKKIERIVPKTLPSDSKKIEEIKKLIKNHVYIQEILEIV